MFERDKDIRFPETADDEDIVEDRPLTQTRDEKRAVRQAKLEDKRRRRMEKIQERRLKMEDKKLRNEYYRSMIPDTPASINAKKIRRGFKKLDRAKKKFKSDPFRKVNLNNSVGGIGKHDFNIKFPSMPKLKNTLNSSALNLPGLTGSSSKSRLKSKRRKRRKYKKKYKKKKKRR